MIQTCLAKKKDSDRTVLTVLARFPLVSSCAPALAGARHDVTCRVVYAETASLVTRHAPGIFSAF